MQLTLACVAIMACVLLLWGQRVESFTTLLQTTPLKVAIERGMGAGQEHAIRKEWELPQNELGLQVAFQILFHKGFEWGCRGKVGGLYVGTGKASGGQSTPTGASLRLMWDGPGRGGYAYVYIPEGSRPVQPRELAAEPTGCSGEKTTYGIEVFKRNFANTFQEGVWSTVVLGMKLNTFDAQGNNMRNGILQMMIARPGRPPAVGVIRNCTWRLSPKTTFNKFEIHVFHGGKCPREPCTAIASRPSRLDIAAIQLSRLA